MARSITFEEWADKDNRGEYVGSLWDKLQSRRNTNRSRWEEIESYIYATDTRSLQGGDLHDHTTHIPVVSEIRDDLAAIMYSTILPHEDWLGWQPYDKDALTISKRSAVGAYIKNRHSLNGFESTVRKLIQDWIDYGNAFAQVQYVDQSSSNKLGVPVGYKGAKVTRISPYDIVFDPTASDFQSSYKVIRTVMSLGEFWKWAGATPLVDTAKVDSVLDRRATYTSLSRTELNKAKQYTPDGFGSMSDYYESGAVELLWFYGDIWDATTKTLHERRCVVVADRMNTLLDIECPDARIYKAGWSDRQDNLWSQGPLDKIIGLNYQINHRENGKSDGLDRTLNPDRVFVGDVEEIYDESTNQVKYLMPEGGNVFDLPPNMAFLTADTHIERLRADARAAARLPSQLVGFRTPGEKSAFEVGALNDGAFRGFLHKAQAFEQEFLEKIVAAEIAVGRENFDSVIQAVDTNEEGLPIIVQITEEDLKSNGKLVPMGARRFARSNQQLQMLNMLANSQLGQLMGNHIVPFALAKAVESLGGFEQYSIVDKFGAIAENAEAQQTVNILQQQQASDLAEPGLTETLLA